MGKSRHILTIAHRIQELKDECSWHQYQIEEIQSVQKDLMHTSRDWMELQKKQEQHHSRINTILSIIKEHKKEKNQKQTLIIYNHEN
jgi:hypothetical protein